MSLAWMVDNPAASSKTTVLPLTEKSRPSGWHLPFGGWAAPWICPSHDELSCFFPYSCSCQEFCISQKVLVKFYQEWKFILPQYSGIENTRDFGNSVSQRSRHKVIKSWVERLQPNAIFFQGWVFAFYLIAFIKTHVLFCFLKNF